MIKKVAAFAAASLFSMNASAGYIQYDILSDDGLSGYFVQNEADHSIAYYIFNVATSRIYESMMPSGTYGNLNWARARYDNQGPSRFSAFAGYSEAYYSTISFNFSATNTPGIYSFTSYFTAVEDEHWPDDPWIIDLKPVVHYFKGKVTPSAIDPEFAATLDWYLDNFGGYPDGVKHIAPRLNVIPEPASMALLTVGAMALGGTSRRRKSPH